MEPNGKSKEAIAYLVTGLTLAIGVVALGHQAISTVDENRKSGEETVRIEVAETERRNRETFAINIARITELEGARVTDAYHRGITDQRLEQIQQLANTNRDNIVASFKELDSKLQRELNLADETLRSQIINLDARLQGEIAVSREAREKSLLGVGLRLDEIERWIKSTAADRWTKTDQAAFESQLGLTLEKKP